MKVLGAIVVIFIGLVIIAAANTPPTFTPCKDQAACDEANKLAYANASKAPASTPRVDVWTHGARIEKLVLKYGASGYVLKPDLHIVNPNEKTTLQDFEIACNHIGGSGTTIRTVRRTIYEAIKPKQTRVLSVDLGFNPSDATSISCRLVYVVAR